ncbi:MAG TPA: four-helix bundle copper-binding protein [Gemmataceae bacterium]|nr:four-helix bundle copper-binding protein [Gemmataceae bacterium]
MTSRTILCLTAIVAVALTILGTYATAQQQDRSPEKQKRAPTPAGAHAAHSEAYEHCAKACNDCQRSCDACATHCVHLVAQGVKEHLQTLQTCQDCANVCTSAAQIVARQGPFSDVICRACAEACARCGKTCEQHANDKMMKQCADECRRCEQVCRDMLQHTGHAAEGRNR